MDNEIFSLMETDAIGEIMNISLGSSATAVSMMLDKKVGITTPMVEVKQSSLMEFSYLEPAVAVEITYTEGLTGTNVMILKREDVKAIVETLMGMEIPDEEFELDEMNMSAVCEVMNQMMGASATALSEFLGRAINISTPEAFEITDVEEFKQRCFGANEKVVNISFNLSIENIVESEFISVLTIELAKEIVSGFGIGEESIEPEPVIPQPVIQQEQPMQPMMQQVQPMQPMMQQVQPMQPMMQQQQPMQPMMQQQQPMQPMMQYSQPMQNYGEMPNMQQNVNYNMEHSQNVIQSPINVQPIVHRNFDTQQTSLTHEQESNLDLIMSVPLEVSVEIGRTKRKVKDILEFTKGTLVELDKLAGENVDIFVNGQCVAKGDVVVIDDCFGVRITDVIKKLEI